MCMFEILNSVFRTQFYVSFKIKGFLFCFLLTADTIIRPPVFNFQVNFFVGPISGYQK